MKKTFYIIDDHEMLRTGTSSYITSNSDWECAGLSATQGEALADFARLSQSGEFPSVIISDLNFYGANTGIDFISEVRSLYPEAKIIVYTMFFAMGIVQRAVQNRANGYISKNASSAELLLCMEKVLSGESFIENDLRNNFIKYNKMTDALTKREKEMMNLILERNTNEEIAKILGIKKTAVENYVSRIYEKIDVKDRTELIERFG